MIPQNTGGAQALEQMEQKRSMLNPADALAQAQTPGKRVRPGMSIREFLSTRGIDVDGPVEQLKQFVKGQFNNASQIGKVLNQPPGQPPATPQTPPQQPPRGGGLGDLLKNM